MADAAQPTRKRVRPSLPRHVLHTSPRVKGPSCGIPSGFAALAPRIWPKAVGEALHQLAQNLHEWLARKNPGAASPAQNLPKLVDLVGHKKRAADTLPPRMIFFNKYKKNHTRGERVRRRGVLGRSPCVFLRFWPREPHPFTF